MPNQFFSQNLDIIFFIYGFAFVTMGVAIFIQPRRESIFKLSDIIWILGAFGLSHGLNEWLDMINLIKNYHSYPWHLFEAVILASSYIFFFEFGRRFLSLSLKKFSPAWRVIAVYYAIIFLLSAFFAKDEPNIFPRYFLGLPGGLLTAAGFFLYYKNNRHVFLSLGVRRYFLIAAISVAIYGILGGIIVPKAPFFPASIINNDSFLKEFGIPVQAFRAFCAVLMAWSVWNILGIFNWEIRQKLKTSLDEIITAKAYVDDVVESIADSLIVIDKDAKIKTVNPATCQLLGYSKQELIGMFVSNIFMEKEIVEILNEIDESAFLLSKDFEIIEANNAFLDMAGLTKEQVLGHYCYKLTHNVNEVCKPPKDKCPVMEAYESGKPCVEMHTHIDKEGKEYLVDVIAMPVRDKSGEIMYYLHLTRSLKGAACNINDARQSPEAMKILVNKLEAYVDTLKIRKIFSEHDLSSLKEFSVFRNLEMYYKAKNTEKIPVNLSGSVMKDGDGRYVGLVCIVKDIREMKRLIQREKEVVAVEAAAQAQRQRAEELEKVYNELEASHLQLQQAQAHLIEAEKMHVIGSIASGVAHEVKNPLAIIIQGVEYLKENLKTQDENVFLILKYIESAISRADNVIGGLLDFSRPSKLDIKPLKVSSVIGASLSLMKHQFDKCHVSIINDIKEDVSDVRLDKNKIEQVFVNLFLNAIQAMPEGGELAVKTYETQLNGKRYVAVEVKDTGKGIAEGTGEKIFEPFFTTKRDIGGTGLGLSIVRNIIDMHGASIEIKNRQDKSGAIVTVMFKV